MRNYILILVAGLMTAAPWACSSDPIDGTTGSGGSGTTGSQTTGTMTATSGSMSSVAVSSSSGMMGDCAGKLSGACGTCGEGSCCAELAACDQTCVDCIAGNGPMGCNMGMAESAVLQCLSDNCQSDCFAPATPPACDAPAVSPTMGSCVTLGPGVVCNPVTNEGCTGPGQACDIDGNSNTYVCYDPPNDVAICGTCSGSNGPFCMAGHTCQGTQCAKYCCNDCDCGSGHCDLAALTGFGLAVGVCVEGAGMPMNCGTGGAGGTGAGTGGAGGTGAGTGGAGTGGAGTGGTGTGGGATTGAGGTGGTGG